MPCPGERLDLRVGLEATALEQGHAQGTVQELAGHRDSGRTSSDDAEVRLDLVGVGETTGVDDGHGRLDPTGSRT